MKSSKRIPSIDDMHVTVPLSLQMYAWNRDHPESIKTRTNKQDMYFCNAMQQTQNAIQLSMEPIGCIDAHLDCNAFLIAMPHGHPNDAHVLIVPCINGDNGTLTCMPSIDGIRPESFNTKTPTVLIDYVDFWKLIPKHQNYNSTMCKANWLYWFALRLQCAS